jgi:hypothetical protein
MTVITLDARDGNKTSRINRALQWLAQESPQDEVIRLALIGDFEIDEPCVLPSRSGIIITGAPIDYLKNPIVDEIASL